MRLHFFSPNHIEPWDYRNVFEVGIGGSETSHVEMAIRLAARGHDVVSYTALPDDQVPHRAHGVYWTDVREAGESLAADGLWIVYRQPSVGLRVTPGPTRRYWLVCQDVWYPDWTSEAVKPFEIIWSLCPRQSLDILERDPSVKAKVVLTSNGVNVERMIEIEHEGGIERDPHRLIWASSPDRGLKEVLTIFERAREQVPDLSLHVFYGMDNIDKICGGDRTKYPWRDSWRQYDRACAMEGVTWHGRVGQRQLAREYLQSGIWCYPTWFSETSCISCMEAQALGAIPITNPIWATGYNVRHGVFVEGTPSDRMVTARYVDAVVRIALDPDAQDRLRGPMMAESRERLTWERWAHQWESFFVLDRRRFQLNHVEGRILNVGCNVDMAGLRELFGATNVDLHTVDPQTGLLNAVDQIADARALPYEDGAFDTVVLADILEHMTDDDAVQALREAARVAGRVVITVPEDDRTCDPAVDYAPGITGHHARPVTRAVLDGWLAAAELVTEQYAPLRDVSPGHGVVAVPSLEGAYVRA